MLIFCSTQRQSNLYFGFQDTFYDALETRSYEGWKLCDIGVWYKHKSLRRMTPFELRIEKKLVEMIPMVYKVKGVLVTECFK